jgi:5'-deoxynucleotidase YfbR-like HD superfamily hydrolase
MVGIEEEEAFLSFVRLLMRAQRVPAVLPDGSTGNVMELAFANAAIVLWRTQHEPELDRSKLMKLVLIEPLLQHAMLNPEDLYAGELSRFSEEVEELAVGTTAEARMIRGGFAKWLMRELSRNAEFRAYWRLVVSVANERRKISVPGRPFPEQPENDAEHSVTLALVVWHAARTVLFENGWYMDQSEALVDAVVHDFVEGIARDTPALGSKAELATKPDREEAALVQIETQFPWLGQLIRQYQAQQSPASKAVKAVKRADKVLAIAIIGLSGGGTWRQYGFSEIWHLQRLFETCPGMYWGELGYQMVLRFHLAYGKELPEFVAK